MAEIKRPKSSPGEQQQMSLWDAMRAAAGGVERAFRQAQNVTVDVMDSMAAPHRRKMYQSLADKFEMRFFEDAKDIKQQWFTRFPLFQGGGGGQYANLLEGKYLNTQLQMFDFMPSMNHTAWRTVMVIKLFHSRVPLFAMWPDGRMDGDTRFLGRHHAKIKLPETSTFATNYQLYASNVDAVLPLFGQKTRQYFAKHSDWSVEGGGEWIMFYHYDRRCRTQNLKDLLNEGCKAFRTYSLK